MNAIIVNCVAWSGLNSCRSTVYDTCKILQVLCWIVDERVDTHQNAISAGFGSLGILWICERSSLPVFKLDVSTRFKYWGTSMNFVGLTLTASQIQVGS